MKNLTSYKKPLKVKLSEKKDPITMKIFLHIHQNQFKEYVNKKREKNLEQ